MRIILIFSLLLLVVSGCDFNDPKVQGAKQMERLLLEGNKRALEESVRLYQEKKTSFLILAMLKFVYLNRLNLIQKNGTRQ